MSIIKEIYDVTRDASKLKGKVSSIKKALKTELKLNRKFLKEIEQSKPVDDKRRKKIIEMLEINELSAAIKYDIPYKLICHKKVSEELAKEFKLKYVAGYDFEKLIESQYLKISYLKKDYENPAISLKARLRNIYKQNRILLKLLE